MKTLFQLEQEKIAAVLELERTFSVMKLFYEMDFYPKYVGFWKNEIPSVHLVIRNLEELYRFTKTFQPRDIYKYDINHIVSFDTTDSREFGRGKEYRTLLTCPYYFVINNSPYVPPIDIAVKCKTQDYSFTLEVHFSIFPKQINRRHADRLGKERQAELARRATCGLPHEEYTLSLCTLNELKASKIHYSGDTIKYFATTEEHKKEFEAILGINHEDTTNS